MKTNSTTSQFDPQTAAIFNINRDPTLIKAMKIAHYPMSEYIQQFLQGDKAAEEFFFARYRNEIDKIARMTQPESSIPMIMGEKQRLEEKLKNATLSGREYLLLYFLDMKTNNDTHLIEASKTDALAKYFVAKYYWARSLKLDVKERQKYFHEAADAGNTQALVHLGISALLERNYDSSSDDEDELSIYATSSQKNQFALTYFNTANHYGSARAPFEIGKLKEKNPDLKSINNESKSPVDYLLLSASRGYPLALNQAGKLAERQNQIGKAAAYYRVAAEVPQRHKNTEEVFADLSSNYSRNLEVFYHVAIYHLVTSSTPITKEDAFFELTMKKFEDALTHHLVTVLELLECEQKEVVVGLLKLLSNENMELVIHNLKLRYDAAFNKLNTAIANGFEFQQSSTQQVHMLPPLVKMMTDYCGVGLFSPHGYQKIILNSKETKMSEAEVAQIISFITRTSS